MAAMRQYLESSTRAYQMKQRELDDRIVEVTNSSKFIADQREILDTTLKDQKNTMATLVR